MQRLDAASLDRVLDFLGPRDRIALAAACPRADLVDAVRHRLYLQARRECGAVLERVCGASGDFIEHAGGVRFQWFCHRTNDGDWHVVVLRRGRSLLRLVDDRKLDVTSKLRRRAGRRDCRGRAYAALLDAAVARCSDPTSTIGDWTMKSILGRRPRASTEDVGPGRRPRTST